MDRVRTFGLAAAGGVVAVAIIVLVGASRSEDGVGPPPEIPRGVVLALLFSVPAVVGLVGVRRRNRALLLAAAASLVPASLSTLTLPLIIPAVLFLGAAFDSNAAVQRNTWLIAAAIVALQVGSLAGLLANTENRCWVAYEGPGGLVYREVSEVEYQQVKDGPSPPVDGGCNSGSLTVRGVGLAAVLAIGSIALAVAAARPPLQTTDEPV